MNIHTPDHELAEKLQKGDLEAFDQIFNKYSGRLFGFALKYLKSKEERKSPKDKLGSPERKQLETKIPAVVANAEDEKKAVKRWFKVNLKSNSTLSNLASKVKSQGFSNPATRIESVLQGTFSREEANKMAQEQGLGIEFKKNEYEEFMNNIRTVKKEWEKVNK